MAVIDLREPDDGSGDRSALVECEVCVVGTGPAGATIAAELASSAVRVTILESGGFTRRPDVDELNEVENAGRPRKLDQWKVRNRIVGGSSHTWGGRSAPFDEIDFEHRSWVPMSGWPLERDDLAPYFKRSASHLGLAQGDGFSDERFYEIAPTARYAVAPDPALLRPFYWQFSRDRRESYPYEYMRFGRHVAERLGPRQTLVTGATVLRVEPTTGADAVRAVVYATPQGEVREIRTSIVVLATGGIENARILLASDTLTPGGLGNTHDNLGRYLMDHPRGTAATFSIDDARRLQRRLGRFNAAGRLYRSGFRLSPVVQREEKLVNAAAWLGEEVADDDPWDAIRWLIRGGRSRLGSAAAITRNLGYVLRGARDYFIRRTGVPRKLSGLHLDIMCEQVPDPESRITLTDRTDRLGQRIPRIDWRVHPEEGRAVRRLTELVAAEFARMGLPVPEIEEWVRAGDGLPESWLDVAHPTGTTRMSARAEDGVVDVNGEVHGVAGLFVAGSSIFPTAGHCNPTQMIVALAVKTADEIRARAGRPTDGAAAALAAIAPSGIAPRGTVLVTGASGRIGRVVVAHLVDAGYQVRATASTIPDASHPSVRWRACDLLTATSTDFDELVDGVDGIIHLAAALGNAPRMPRVNTDATRMLAEAAERRGVAAMCYTSTISVYGSPIRRDVDEESPVLTLERDVAEEYLAMDYVRAYGRTKLAGERAIADVARSTRYVIFRPTVVVDVDQLIAIRNWSATKRLLAAHRHAQHVYVRDVADALIWALERSWSRATPAGSIEVLNLGEDEVVRPRYVDFMREAYRASGDPRFRTVPLPGVFDWAGDQLRFRRLSRRHPLWRARFLSHSLRARGFTPRYGVAFARSLALEHLRDERRASQTSSKKADG